MLTSETQRAELLARVLRKEYLAKLCEHGKITPEEYLLTINAMRAEEQLPPLTPEDAASLAHRGSRRRSRRKPA